MKYILLFLLVVMPHLVTALESQWQNQCPDADVLFCDHVGKTAFNAIGPAAMRDVPLGTIEGVIYRPAGSLIGISDALPDAGIPEEIRTAPEDGWYYIINDHPGNKPFLRWAREIQAH